MYELCYVITKKQLNTSMKGLFRKLNPMWSHAYRFYPPGTYFLNAMANAREPVQLNVKRCIYDILSGHLTCGLSLKPIVYEVIVAVTYLCAAEVRLRLFVGRTHHSDGPF